MQLPLQNEYLYATVQIQGGIWGGKRAFPVLVRNNMISLLSSPNSGMYGQERPCHSMWLFHLRNIVRIQTFYPVFPLAGSTAKAFCWLFL